jgi:MATE family multidrug resistance protein
LASSFSTCYGPDLALAAVGVANQIAWTLMTLFMAVAMGCTVLVARETGARQMDAANVVLRQSLLLGLLMGLAGALLSTLFAHSMLEVLGAEPAVVDQGAVFLRLSGAGLLPAALLAVGNAALRGVGDTRTPLFVMLAVNLVNIVVAWLLVNGNMGLPALGVAGSAWGAAASRTVGALLVLGVLLRGRSGLKLRLRPDWRPAVLWRVLRLGLPFGAEQFVFQGALLLYVRVVTGLGTVAYAAHNITITIESISFLPGMGFAVAATTLVSQHLGARDPEGAIDSARESFRMAAAFMGLMGVVFVLLPRLLLGFFVADAHVVAAATRPLQIIGFAQPLLAMNFIYSGALRGAGDAKFPLLSKIVSTWLTRMPLALLLVNVLGWGLAGAWVAMGCDFAVQALSCLYRFRRGRWRDIKV